MPNVSSTPEERSMHGRLNAHKSWANTTDRSKRTENGRAKFEQRFLDQAGGDPQRAEHLRKAYFLELTLKSVQSRRQAKELLEQAEAAEAELSENGAG